MYVSINTIKVFLFVSGDSMAYNNGRKFSTRDNDNDLSLDKCAVLYKGAWWYDACSNCNLNGVYHPSSSATDYTGIWWYHFHGSNYSLKKATMMIKRTAV